MNSGFGNSDFGNSLTPGRDEPQVFNFPTDPGSCRSETETEAEEEAEADADAEPKPKNA